MAYTFFDAHCDTIQKLCDSNQSLYKNNCHVNLVDMSKHKHIRVFAAYVDKKNDILLPFARCNQLIDYYYEQLQENRQHIMHCNSCADISYAVNSGRIAAILSIEGGEALEGKISNLKYFYQKGIRLITLSWNYENEICDGICEERGRGLTNFGIKAIEEMNRLGIIIDVSHISQKGFWDVIEHTSKPITASHSNVFELKNHKRNLNRRQIEAIIKNNGCIGINFYTEFLSDKKSSITDILRHIEYILALGGENNIGFGSDFDGMNSLPDGISGVGDMAKLPEEMLKIGYSENLVKKITHKNFLRLFKEVL